MMQYGACKCSTMQYCAYQCGVMQCGACECSAVHVRECSLTRCVRLQYGAGSPLKSRDETGCLETVSEERSSPLGIANEESTITSIVTHAVSSLKKAAPQ